MEREGIPSLGLFIERATDRTPDTRKFHVYLGDELVISCTTRKKAKEVYRQLVAESGYVPPRAEPAAEDNLSPVEREILQRGMDAAEEYWGSTKLYRKRGGYR